MDYLNEYVIVDIRKNKKNSLPYHGEVFSVDISEHALEIESKFIAEFMEDKFKKHFVFVMSKFSFEDL